MKAAAELACAMLLDLCSIVLQIKEANPQLWYPPEYSPIDFDNIVPSQFTFYQQCGSNLGERMCQTFAQFVREDPRNRVIIIGSDCITHTPSSLQSAFLDLDSYPVIIQPSDDGGYALIGQSCWYPDIFYDIDWGHNNVYANSIKKMRHGGILHRILPYTFDVDCFDDLKKLTQFIEYFERPYTAAWMQKNHWL